MVLAIANRQSLADQPHMQAQDLEDVTEGMEPPVSADLDDDVNYCVREAGQRVATSSGPSRG